MPNPIPVQIYLYQRIEVRRVLSMALLVIAEANHVRKAVSTVNDSVNEEYWGCKGTAPRINF